MSEHEKVETELHVKDSSSAAIERITHSTEKLRDITKDVIGVLTGVGGLAGIWEIKETVAGMNETYRAVARISTMTGLASQEAHGLRNMFQQSGIEAQEAERVVFMLAKKMDNIGEMGGAGAKEMQHELKGLGVNIKEDVIGQLEAMSVAAQRGKLDIGSLVRIFGVRGENAIKLLGALKKGPGQIKEFVEEAEKSGLTAADMASFSKMTAAKRQLSRAWEEMALTVYKRIIPAVTQVVTMIRGMVEHIAPKVERVGEVLRTHMVEIVKLAKMYAQYMLVNKALGFVGVGGGILGKRTEGGGRSGGLVQLAGNAMFGGVAAAFRQSRGKEVMTEFGALGGQSNVLGGLGAFFKLLGNFTKLAGIGLAIAVVVEVFRKFPNITAKLAELGEKVMGILGRFAEALAPVVGWLIKLADVIIDLVTWIVEHVPGLGKKDTGSGLTKGFETVSRLGNMIGANTEGIRGLSGMQQLAMFRTADALSRTGYSKGIAEGWAGILKEKAKFSNTQDFRGSKFDITQNFAEGFDPDRVATAFANELGTIGERQLMSGLGPSFGVR